MMIKSIAFSGVNKRTVPQGTKVQLVKKTQDAEDMQGDDRLVFAENFLRDDMKKAVEKIRDLNENPEMYNQVISQPLVTGEDAEESFFHPLRISRSFRIVLEDLESFAAKDD
uniref:Uncharacterized protein n=1 Tax=Lotharella globosa TaxID=91324 RepID=A0A7S3YFV8_9EUKA